MTKQRPIAELKPTGVSWLKTIPQQWQLARFKSLFAERTQRSSLDDAHLTPSQKHGVLTQEDYMERTGTRVVLNLTAPENMKHVEPGDFISHLRSFQGGLERSEIPGKVSMAYTVLRPKARVHGPFFKHLMKSDRYIQALRVTTDQLRDGQSIRFRELDKIYMPVPPMREQAAIAEFLDRETAKIDALIDKQRGLMAGLRRRRTAVVDAALNGSVAGAVATEVTRIGHIVHLVNAPVTAGDTDFTVALEDMVSGAARLSTDIPHRPGSVGARFDRGDVLYGKLRPYLRKVWVADRPGIALGDIHVYRPLAGVNSQFVASSILSDFVATPIESSVYGAKMPRASWDFIKTVEVKYGDPNFQTSVVSYVRREAARIEVLIAKSERLIELSMERRAALITAAVTGQIDVRDMESGKEAA